MLSQLARPVLRSSQRTFWAKSNYNNMVIDKREFVLISIFEYSFQIWESDNNSDSASQI